VTLLKHDVVDPELCVPRSVGFVNRRFFFFLFFVECVRHKYINVNPSTSIGGVIFPMFVYSGFGLTVSVITYAYAYDLLIILSIDYH